MLRNTSVVCLAILLTIAAGCGGEGDSSASSSGSSDTPPVGGAVDAMGEAAGGAVGAAAGDARTALVQQIALIRGGDVEALRATFTERLRDRITPEAVTAAVEELKDMTIDDFVGSIEPGESEGNETAKIMMPNGRSLTTFIKVDGRWLADTIWFR